MTRKDYILLEHAYQLVSESHAPFQGLEDDIIYVDDLEGQVNKLRQAINDGRGAVLKHVAHRDDMQEMGAPASDSTYYIFDKATDFTHPAFILT
jgi:hypothetical protein